MVKEEFVALGLPEPVEILRVAGDRHTIKHVCPIKITAEELFEAAKIGVTAPTKAIKLKPAKFLRKGRLSWTEVYVGICDECLTGFWSP